MQSTPYRNQPYLIAQMAAKGFFVFLMSGRVRFDWRTLAANNLYTAYNSDSVFAQIDAEFILLCTYLLLVMIRLIEFKSLQITCTKLVFRFLIVI